MSEQEEPSRMTSRIEEEEAKRETIRSCDGIQDPVRKALCKVCNMPVLGVLPFCHEHKPPVP